MKTEDSQNELLPVTEDDSIEAFFDLVTSGEEPEY